MHAPNASPPAPSLGKWQRRGLEVLPAAVILLFSAALTMQWGHWLGPGFPALWLGPFAALVSLEWTAQNETYALRCVPVALASISYPAIVFWIWPRWTEQASGMRALALGVAALLWCAMGFYTLALGTA